MSKGIWGGLFAEFMAAVTIVAMAVILIMFLKIHVTEIVVDYYNWGKEYYIPLALLSTDINGNASSIIFTKLNSQILTEEEKNKILDEIKGIVNLWFFGNREGAQEEEELPKSYILRIGNDVIQEELNCYCAYTGGLEYMGTCQGECGGKEGTRCNKDEDCFPRDIIILKIKQYSTYPVPLINSSVIEMSFETMVYKQIEGD